MDIEVMGRSERDVQRALEAVLTQAVGGYGSEIHTEWESWCTTRRFIDGSLVHEGELLLFLQEVVEPRHQEAKSTRSSISRHPRGPAIAAYMDLQMRFPEKVYDADQGCQHLKKLQASVAHLNSVVNAIATHLNVAIPPSCGDIECEEDEEEDEAPESETNEEEADEEVEAPPKRTRHSKPNLVLARDTPRLPRGDRRDNLEAWIAPRPPRLREIAMELAKTD